MEKGENITFFLHMKAKMFLHQAPSKRQLAFRETTFFAENNATLFWLKARQTPLNIPLQNELVNGFDVSGSVSTSCGLCDRQQSHRNENSPKLSRVCNFEMCPPSVSQQRGND